MNNLWLIWPIVSFRIGFRLAFGFALFEVLASGPSLDGLLLFMIILEMDSG